MKQNNHLGLWLGLMGLLLLLAISLSGVIVISLFAQPVQLVQRVSPIATSSKPVLASASASASIPPPTIQVTRTVVSATARATAVVTSTTCQPQITSFTADRITINPGESAALQWGAITNAQGIEIDNGVGAVSAPGTRTIAPSQTTTFTLSAVCGGNRITKSVTITVTGINPKTGTPGTSSQRRKLDGIWAGGKYTFQMATDPNCTSAECQVKGEFAEWGGNSLPPPGEITGTLNVNTGKFNLSIALMPTGTRTFTGAVDATSTSITGQLSNAGTISLAKQSR